MRSPRLRQVPAKPLPTACYRLIKYAGANRILFLVDRANLGKQAEAEFRGYQPSGEPRKFTELYTTQLLKGRAIDPQATLLRTDSKGSLHL